MARLSRLCLPGLPHLVLQRGHERTPVFVDDTDRRDYLAALLDASRERAVALHGYVLLDQEVWLLLTPSSETALSLMMQSLGRRYVAGFHRRHGGRGTLWEGRFRATVMDPAEALIGALRFIEQAPLRAGRVARAQDWPWSSARHHLGLERDGLVQPYAAYWTLGNTPFEREERWRVLLDDLLTPPVATRIAEATWKGWPLGGGAFLANLSRRTVRPVQARPRGRPRKVREPA